MYKINKKSFNTPKYKKGMNIKDLNKLIIKILRYSDMKINAKEKALYSVLKPLTNSDSPSEKSNGVRFVSARIEVNQIKYKGINKKKYPINIS